MRLIYNQAFLIKFINTQSLFRFISTQSLLIRFINSQSFLNDIAIPLPTSMKFTCYQSIIMKWGV